MRLKLFCLFVIQLIGIILIIGNPDLNKHKEFARNVLLSEFPDRGNYIEELVSIVVEEKIYRNDYLFFSITEFNDIGSLKNIGLGIFGTILPMEFVKDHSMTLILSVIGFFVILRLIVKKYNI